MLIDLSDRAKYRVTGKDRCGFLNGQLTNDILTLRPGSAIAACALTAKGKLCADLFVAATGESLSGRGFCSAGIARDSVGKIHYRGRCHLGRCDRRIRPLSSGTERRSALCGAWKASNSSRLFPSVSVIQGSIFGFQPIRRVGPGEIETIADRCRGRGKSPHRTGNPPLGQGVVRRA